MLEAAGDALQNAGAILQPQADALKAKADLGLDHAKRLHIPHEQLSFIQPSLPSAAVPTAVLLQLSGTQLTAGTHMLLLPACEARGTEDPKQMPALNVAPKFILGWTGTEECRKSGMLALGSMHAASELAGSFSGLLQQQCMGAPA